MGRAVILTGTGEGQRACASAARISTTGGGAVEQFEQAQGGKKDVSLVKKVLASGHQSVFEHQTYFVGFENVSVAVEQFVIEARLGSYTVKSRRYVDFSGAGYVTPEDMPQKEAYQAHMDGLFTLYEQLLAEGVSREDSRFVLPYCFCSNFYMTMNARELCRLVCQMAYGRGANMPEIKALGESLIGQMEESWPGALEVMKKGYSCKEDIWALPRNTACGEAAPKAKLIRAEENAEARLAEAMRFTGREEMSISELISDPRARELEFLTYEFDIEDVSLACVTHFSRHRIQSILVPDVREGLSAGHYIVPEAVRNSSLYGEYCAAFERSRQECARMLENGMPKAYAAYYALAGMTIPLKLRMNARELALFLRLRTCERAQWEIRALARDMLLQLRESAPGVFSAFGPSCKVLGYCPEGRLSCGNPPKL
ncbi:MAG: FAD-dependent thymidylate synthase [Clostridia bacterium]|nr:FAD-dependent thymidylate synthase [Clostridia bacterium]